MVCFPSEFITARHSYVFMNGQKDHIRPLGGNVGSKNNLGARSCLSSRPSLSFLSSVMQRRRASNGVDGTLQSNMSLKGIKLVNLDLVFISSCEEERRCLIWCSSSCCEQNTSACQKWDKFHLKRRKLVFKKDDASDCLPGCCLLLAFIRRDNKNVRCLENVSHQYHRGLASAHEIT